MRSLGNSLGKKLSQCVWAARVQTSQSDRKAKNRRFFGFFGSKFRFRILLFILGLVFALIFSKQILASEMPENDGVTSQNAETVVVLSAGQTESEAQKQEIQDPGRTEGSELGQVGEEQIEGSENKYQGAQEAVPVDNSNNSSQEKQSILNEKDEFKDKLPQVVRETESIGTPDKPTIDGGLISAPELTEELEAKASELELQNLNALDTSQAQAFIAIFMDKFQNLNLEQTHEFLANIEKKLIQGARGKYRSFMIQLKKEQSLKISHKKEISSRRSHAGKNNKTHKK